MKNKNLLGVILFALFFVTAAQAETKAKSEFERGFEEGKKAGFKNSAQRCNVPFRSNSAYEWNTYSGFGNTILEAIKDSEKKCLKYNSILHEECTEVGKPLCYVISN